jgi:hypothetical protein
MEAAKQGDFGVRWHLEEEDVINRDIATVTRAIRAGRPGLDNIPVKTGHFSVSRRCDTVCHQRDRRKGLENHEGAKAAKQAGSGFENTSPKRQPGRMLRAAWNVTEIEALRRGCARAHSDDPGEN